MSPACDSPEFLPPDRCDDDALIQMKDIVKTFKNAAGEFTALKGVTACMFSGEFVSIVGKSGSGKSTLVNMLTGIDHPTSGTVRVGSTYIHAMSENDMSLWRGQNLGIVFQFYQLMPTLTLLENIILPMVLAGLYKPAERERRALELLALVGLGDFADKLPAAVSGGQQQSAAIARALANDPPILIADEPTGNLDTRSADDVFKLFSELVEQNKTILVVTHDVSLAKRTQRTLLLSDGELINPWVAEAFPDLPHIQMLWLTHQLQEEKYSPGDQVSLDGGLGLYLLACGEIVISLDGRQGKPAEPICLKSGDSLSSLDLLVTGRDPLAARVTADGPARLFKLDEGTFRGWLGASPAAQKSLEKASQNRGTRHSVVFNNPGGEA
jgi:putative ABC transport system ATP-binding protein